MYLYLNKQEDELLTEKTREFNDKNNLDLSRQKFLLKLLKDHARKRSQE